MLHNGKFVENKRPLWSGSLGKGPSGCLGPAAITVWRSPHFLRLTYLYFFVRLFIFFFLEETRESL